MATKKDILGKAKALGVTKAQRPAAVAVGIQKMLADATQVYGAWKRTEPTDAQVAQVVRRWQQTWRGLTEQDASLHDSNLATLMSLGNTRGETWGFAGRVINELRKLR